MCACGVCACVYVVIREYNVCWVVSSESGFVADQSVPLLFAQVGLAADDADKCAYFLCTLLWPFIDAHWVAILALFSLLPNRKIGEELLISQMQWFAEKLFFDGVIAHFDACSKESMRCAVTVLIKHLKVLRVGVTTPHGCWCLVFT
jgi:hypothetical protein